MTVCVPLVNACLTCPVFQTTPEFLDVHRQQATVTRKLIGRADANANSAESATRPESWTASTRSPRPRSPR